MFMVAVSMVVVSMVSVVVAASVVSSGLIKSPGVLMAALSDVVEGMGEVCGGAAS